MYCRHCGKQVEQPSAYCPHCGVATSESAEPAGTPSPDSSPASPIVDQAAPISGKAVASLVLGLLSLLLPAAIAAVVLGHVARSQIRRSAGRLRGSGLALTGLILGYLGIALVPIVIFLGLGAAIAVPGLMRARQAGNEASVIGSLRAINSAQSTYAAACGQGNYAGALADLGKAPQSGTVGFVAADLSTDPTTKSGYVIALTPGQAAPAGPVSCNAGSMVLTYFVSAEPISGQGRFFATNQEGTIFQATTPLPKTQVGAPLGGTPIQ